MKRTILAYKSGPGPQPSRNPVNTSRLLLATVAALLATAAAASAAPTAGTTVDGVWQGSVVCQEGGYPLTVTMHGVTNGRSTPEGQQPVEGFLAMGRYPGYPNGVWYLLRGVAQWRSSGMFIDLQPPPD